MKKYVRPSVTLTIALLLLLELTAIAQIQDIKKNSSNNKSYDSNNNSSNSSDFGSSILEGCFDIFFNSLVGCLFSGRDRSENKNNYNAINQNQNPNNNALLDSSFIPINQNNDSSFVLEKQSSDNNLVTENQFNNPNENIYIENQKNSNPEIPAYESEKKPIEFSLDIKPIFAYGFEFSSDKTYNYMNYLPGLRANLAWFLIDYRYNLLTENTENNFDAFKTWDLTFCFNLKFNENSNLFFGAGMHYEENTETNFFELYVGAKFGLSQNRDYLDTDVRLSVDSNDPNNPDDDVFPFNEIGIHYNKRFINSKNLNGYISIGGIYQNYYSSTDIWAIQAGVIFNWHN